MSVAERLVRARGDRRREDVANAVGVSVSAIAMYENGGRVPRDETKIKLADFYGMTVQALFLIDKCHITCLPKKARRNERAQAQAHERSTPMKTIDDYKEALEHAGSAVQEKLLAQADALERALPAMDEQGPENKRGAGGLPGRGQPQH